MLKFGIVGTNFVSDMFMEGLKLNHDVEAVSVCSGKYENACKFAEKYNIKNIYHNYLEMIESKTIDAIYLAVPNSMHHEFTINCLKHKIPTYCEKPFAGNVKQVKEMVQAAIDNDTYLQDGTLTMYQPNLPILKEYIKKVGVLRRAVIVIGQYSSRYDAYLKGENPTTFRRELYNGSIMDLGIYIVSLANALFGKPQEIISEATLLDTGVDCAGIAILKYDGFDCILLHSKCTNTKIISEIQGESGNIYIPNAESLESILYEPRKGEAIEVGNKCLDEFTYSIREFADNFYANKKQSDKFTFADIIQTHEILTEARIKSGVIYDCD